jgi:predicted transcriptional regulator
MVVRLDPPHRHKNVLNIIENFDRIGFNELYEKLREKSQTSMAKSTLKKVVDELVENKIIARIPKGKQNYQFTVDVKSVKKEKSALKKIDKLLGGAEKKFLRLQKLNEKGSLSRADLVTLTHLFLHSIWFLDWQIFSVLQFSETKNLDEKLERLNKLKKDVFEFTFFQDIMDRSITSHLNYYIESDSKNSDFDFTADLEKFEDGAKHG